MRDRKIERLIEFTKKDKKIVAVALFGSSLKGKGQDIDICLFLNKKYSNLEMSKKRLSYLKFNDDFDIQIFQQLPVYIRIQVLKEMKILFCRDEDFIYDIAYDTIKEFNFYEKIYNMHLEAIKNG